MLDDTATSSAVTSSRDGDVIDTNDVVDDAPAATASHDCNISQCDVRTAADVSSTSSVTSPAAVAGAVSRLGERSECRVCSDEAAGMYFGALVCVPCKVRPAHVDSCQSYTNYDTRL